MEILTYIVSLILLFTPFIDWTATIILYRAYKAGQRIHESSITLRERAMMAGVLAVASTANSILAVNRLFELHINNIFAILILSVSLLLVSVPNFYWLWLYLKNRIR